MDIVLPNMVSEILISIDASAERFAHAQQANVYAFRIKMIHIQQGNRMKIAVYGTFPAIRRN